MFFKIGVSMAAAAVLISAPAFAQFPAGYPADYQKIVDAAKKKARWWCIPPRIPKPQGH